MIRAHVLSDGRTVHTRTRVARTGARKYVEDTGGTPPPPDSIRLDSIRTSFPPLGNDKVGDCEEAGGGHHITLWSDGSINPSEADTLQAYSEVTGYNGSPASDQGTDPAQFFTYLMQTGFPAGGTRYKVADQLSVKDLTDDDSIKTLVVVSGGALLQFDLYDEWIQNARDGAVWDVLPNRSPNPQNGHCVLIIGYNAQGVVVTTWTFTITVTWAAIAEQAKGNVPAEVDGFLSPLWLAGRPYYPADETKMLWESLKGGPTPAPQPDPAPVPVSPPPPEPQPIPAPAWFVTITEVNTLLRAAGWSWRKIIRHGAQIALAALRGESAEQIINALGVNMTDQEYEVEASTPSPESVDARLGFHPFDDVFAAATKTWIVHRAISLGANPSHVFALAAAGNWQGIIQLLQQLLANAPQIISEVMAVIAALAPLLALFGA